MVTTQIKPLETLYNGCLYRSRTEARWAVYFDTLHIDFEYEKEGFDLGRLGRYLPDFWLPRVRMWAEVKGQAFTLEERDKCNVLARLTERPVLMLDGPPKAIPYMAFWPRIVSMDHIDMVDVDEYDCMVTASMKWYWRENRFYADTGINRYSPGETKWFQDIFPDTVYAANMARSARFGQDYAR